MKITPMLALLAAAYAQAQLIVNTPVNAVQCESVLLTWNGGESPFFVDVLPGNDLSSPALVDFGGQTGTSLTWKVDVSAGTTVLIQVRDATGAIADSAPFTIADSDDNSCL